MQAYGNRSNSIRPQEKQLGNAYDQDQLDACRVLAQYIRATLEELRRSPAPEKLFSTAVSLAGCIEMRLERLGAKRPTLPLEKSQYRSTELMDTAANRNFLRKLYDAREAGFVVDGERIATGSEMQMIEMIIEQKELEIYGPGGVPD